MNRQNETSRIIDRPEPGFFLIRLVPKGPLVAARIVQTEAGWQTVINGEASPFFGDWAHPDCKVMDVWTGRRTTEQEYEYRLECARVAALHFPNAPEAKPRQAIDLRRLPPIT